MPIGIRSETIKRGMLLCMIFLIYGTFPSFDKKKHSAFLVWILATG